MVTLRVVGILKAPVNRRVSCTDAMSRKGGVNLCVLGGVHPKTQLPFLFSLLSSFFPGERNGIRALGSTHVAWLLGNAVCISSVLQVHLGLLILLAALVVHL